MFGKSLRQSAALWLALSVAALCDCRRMRVEADGDGAAFVERINASVAPVKPGDRKAIRAACATLVEQAFDIAAMAPTISGEAWKRMNAGQRQAYARGLPGAPPPTAPRMAARSPATRSSSSACATATAATGWSPSSSRRAGAAR